MPKLRHPNFLEFWRYYCGFLGHPLWVHQVPSSYWGQCLCAFTASDQYFSACPGYQFHHSSISAKDSQVFLRVWKSGNYLFIELKLKVSPQICNFHQRGKKSLVNSASISGKKKSFPSKVTFGQRVLLKLQRSEQQSCHPSEIVFPPWYLGLHLHELFTFKISFEGEFGENISNSSFLGMLKQKNYKLEANLGCLVSCGTTWATLWNSISKI